MLDIKVNGTKIEIVVEGNGIDVVAEFIGSFFKLTKHISALAAKEEKRVANIEKEILATVVALYITEETGRNAGTLSRQRFARCGTLRHICCVCSSLSGRDGRLYAHPRTGCPAWR